MRLSHHIQASGTTMASVARTATTAEIRRRVMVDVPPRSVERSDARRRGLGLVGQGRLAREPSGWIAPPKMISALMPCSSPEIAISCP